MGHHLEKKLPGFSVTYLHDFHHCLKCKLAMESNIQIGRPRKFLLKKRKVSSDIIQPNHSKFLVKAKLNSEPTLKLSEPVDPVKLSKKILFKKKVRDMFFSPIKALLDIPSTKFLLKKKNSNKIHPKKVENFLCDYKKKNLKSAQKLAKPTKQKPALIGSVKSNSIKKSPRKSVDKGNGSKVPGKGTLKRKRWIHDQFIQENENYEDDIYEQKKFEHFQSLLGEDSDSSEKYDGMKTPNFDFCLSPRATTPSPTFKDCYNPAQLKKLRKGAEEYQYRRKKRMSASNSKNKSEEPRVEQQPIRESEVTNKLDEVVKILTTQHTNDERVSESEDDQYFCDLLNGANQVDRT